MNVLTVRGVGFGGFASDWVLAQAGTKRFTGDDQTLQVGILPPPQPPPPALSSIWPAGGPPQGGTLVTITGLNFDVGGTNQILFDGVPATAVSCTLPTQCTAIAPPGNGIESVSVVVDGTASPSWSAPLQYTYSPTVTSLSETSGSINDTITINGIGLAPATGNATAIHFGSYAATSFNCSPSECSVLVPPGSGTVDVTVTNGSTTTSLWPADKFTYTAVSITSISPSTGGIAGGERVTITGHGFDPLGKNMQVVFGSVPSSYIMCNGDTSCLVASPPGALGPVAITVQAFGETSATSAADVFTYMNEPPVLGMEYVDGKVNGDDYLVWLAGAAPPGGAIVNFWSANPALVSFPPSVTIPAGQTQATVHVVYGPATTSGLVAFTATCGGAPYSGSLNYSAGPGTPGLSFSYFGGLEVNSSEVLTLTLADAAPAGGAVVSLTSSSPSAIAVPTTVVVPAGAYSTTFSITNLYDGAPEIVTLTASPTTV